ncbi:MAG TPA: hypothetical protein QF549_01290 [Candidatus Saccharimonadaceae bacterium]|nr:hypothetical protein [Candidatus Saccharimonadaceae bacterium]
MDLIDRPSRTEEVREAGKLFDFVVRHTPEEVFRAMDAPEVTELGEASRVHFGTTYKQKFEQESSALELLKLGVADTAKFVEHILAQHSTISIEQAYEIARHERTIRSLAIVARQSNLMSGVLLRSPGLRQLTPEEDAITLADHIQPSRIDGCPAVEVHGHDVRPWPLFERFGRWAGELTVRAHFHHIGPDAAHARQDESSLV